jgi:hypothetical protein
MHLEGVCGFSRILGFERSAPALWAEITCTNHILFVHSQSRLDSPFDLSLQGMTPSVSRSER